jgi:hypothetical protein
MRFVDKCLEKGHDELTGIARKKITSSVAKIAVTRPV